MYSSWYSKPAQTTTALKFLVVTNFIGVNMHTIFIICTTSVAVTDWFAISQSYLNLSSYTLTNELCELCRTYFQPPNSCNSCEHNDNKVLDIKLWFLKAKCNTTPAVTRIMTRWVWDCRIPTTAWKNRLSSGNDDCMSTFTFQTYIDELKHDQPFSWCFL